MSNPFAKFEAQAAPARQSGKGGRRQQQGGGQDGDEGGALGGKNKPKAVNIANLLDDDANNAKQRQQQQAQNQRGFKVVEAKPKEKKPKAKKSEESVGQPQNSNFYQYGVMPAQNKLPEPDHNDKAQAWAFYQAQQEELARKTKELEKAKKKKWGSGPVGGSVVDPDQEKAERKAVEKLRKHVSKQAAGKAKSGGAYTDLVRPTEEAPEEEAPAPAPKKGRTLVVVAEEPKLKPQWGLPSTVACAVASTEHADPMAELLPKAAAQPVGKKSGKKAKQEKREAELHQAREERQNAEPKAAPRTPEHQPKRPLHVAAAEPLETHTLLENDDNDDEPSAKPQHTNSNPSTPIHTPMKAKNSVLTRMDKLSGASHHHDEDDGSVKAMTRYFFVLENGATLSIGGAGLSAEEQKSAAMAPKILANQLVKRRPVKGGFFITVEGKHFLDQTCIGEPWMADSILSALTNLLKKPESKTSAYPCWEQATGGRQMEEEEHEITMQLFQSTALELKHVNKHSTIRVPLKECRISLRPFIRDLVSQCKYLESVVQRTIDAVGSAVLDEKQRESYAMVLPKKTAHYRHLLEEAAGEYWRGEAELDAAFAE